MIMNNPIPNVAKPSALHTAGPALLTVVGVVLIAYMVSAEGEPGGLPPLLIAAGAAWFVVARVRTPKGRG